MLSIAYCLLSIVHWVRRPQICSLENKLTIMNELVNQIIEKTGIPADKAQMVLGVVAGYIKQKFPQFGGQIDSVLGTSGEQPGNTGSGNPLSDLGSKLGF